MKNLSLRDRIYQWISVHLPQRLIWFCLFRAWSWHQTITKDNKLPSQVLVVELIKRLDERNFKVVVQE